MDKKEIQEFADRITAAEKSGFIVIGDTDDVSVKFFMDRKLDEEEAFMTFLSNMTAVITAASKALDLTPEQLCMFLAYSSASDLLVSDDDGPFPVVC